jgi:hypothetical protein
MAWDILRLDACNCGHTMWLMVSSGVMHMDYHPNTSHHWDIQRRSHQDMLETGRCIHGYLTYTGQYFRLGTPIGCHTDLVTFSTC